MQELIDILTFKTMISGTMLFIFYYLGAIVVPFIIYLYTKNKDAVANRLTIWFSLAIHRNTKTC